MRLVAVILASTMLFGCSLMQPVHEEQNLTLGTVQNGIHVGMSGAEVVEVLGSPNIVSTDAYRNEVWIYDKFSTESIQTDEPGALGLLQYFADVEAFTDSSRRHTESSNQKTLTVIIKFDEYERVRDYAYHVSRF
jgi:outer membrane protein assembly factor BamE (lipoprotein component of BamABCDE complex)